jgi:peptidoglycan/xylan/chitin deacetylase (PgdA/CDA1 family)
LITSKYFKGPLLAALFFSTVHAAEVAITIDDFNVRSPEGDQQILDALKKHNVKAALFVTCKYLENPMVMERLSHWEKAGHLIANHTYSHQNYNKSDFEAYKTDILHCHEKLKARTGFKPLFRFPFLKGGDTPEKNQRIQSFLKDHGYKNGYVTIDASDWYISDELLKSKKKDTSPYRNYYLKHIRERALYYDGLAQKYWKKPVKHTLLIHHNQLNSLYLGDLLEMFKNKGWKVVDAAEAFQDPVFDLIPDVIPAGESLMWTLAKKAGDKNLRMPGEDSVYEEAAMKKAGL